MLQRIQITNLGGFTEVDFILPAIALIQGGNGTGKSTLLDCIKYVGERGHDPDIIHGDAKWGEVILTLDDGYQLRARPSRETGETTRGWKSPDGKKWIANRSQIDRVYQAIGYDPLSFLAMDAKKQAELLLQLAPIPIAPEEITSAVGSKVRELPDIVIPTTHKGLEAINAIGEAIFNYRTGVGRDKDRMEKHAAELANTLPQDAPGGDWIATLEKLEANKKAIEAKERAGIASLKRDFDTKKDAAVKKETDAITEIDQDIDGQIAKLELLRMSRKDAARAEKEQFVEGARSTANDQATALRAELKPEVERLSSEIGAAKVNAAAQQQAEGTRAAIATAKADADKHAAAVIVCTDAINRLRDLKAKVADRLPIPGVTTKDGRIVREQDGALVPLRKWNTADQYVFALRIGMMIGAGFVCVDRCESFDDEHRRLLYKTAQRYAEQKGIQFILASVRREGGALALTSPESSPATTPVTTPATTPVTSPVTAPVTAPVTSQ